MKIQLFQIIAFIACIVCSMCYNNGVAGKPPMGWNTWCTEDLCGTRDICTEKLVKETADQIVSQGLDKLGYQYVTLDDCWADTSRDANGKLQPSKHFPSGMQSLAQYVHSKGLKIGLYTCIGTETCKRGRPGSYGHYDLDAQTFNDWEIDFVKADNCHVSGSETHQELYEQFSVSLNQTGRPILFSLCEWGNDNVIDWGYKVGQMFRIQMDHLPLWKFPPYGAGMGFGQGTANIIEYMATIHPGVNQRQYGWMDPDFLMTLFLKPLWVPFTTNTFVNSRTEFSFWSLWQAPLLVATDLRSLSKQKKKILMNTEVIAINQDELVQGGERLFNNSNGGQAWYKPLQNGDVAVILYNSNDFFHASVTISFDQIGFSITDNLCLRDLWEHKNLGFYIGSYSKKVKAHDVQMMRIRKNDCNFEHIQVE